MLDKMIKGLEKELMSSFSQMLGIVYTEPNEESETMNAQIEKPDIEDSNKKNSNGTWWRPSSRFDSHEFLDIGQKEVNRTWWQPPLRPDSWKPVQSWSMILQWKQTLTKERN
ncbi:hypothetical protein Bca101_075361 [Brassica carinata]